MISLQENDMNNLKTQRGYLELQTQDLNLRIVDAGDTEEVARMWEFEKGSISTEAAQKAIEDMQNNYKQNKRGCIHHLCLAVFEKGKRSIIGWCGLDGETAGKLHIFYLIDAAYRNKGYATQCAEKLISYAFDDMDMPFVNGGCAKDNTASFKVMSKIGMKQNAFEDNGDPLFYIDKELYQKIYSR